VSGCEPGAAQGWEYYSDAQGRVEVVAGRLRLEGKDYPLADGDVVIFRFNV